MNKNAISLQKTVCLHSADSTSSFLKDMQVFHYKEGPETHMKAAVNREGAIQASMVHCDNTKRECGSLCVFVRVYAEQERTVTNNTGKKFMWFT